MATYTVYELPFTAYPQYVTARLVGVEYRFRLAWNRFTECWVIDIATAAGAPIANGIPLVTGADLLEQFTYLEIGGQMLVVTDQTATGRLVPSFDDLGLNGHVFFIPDDARPL
jgi:hypothetical protein